jgi:hypothetical protein
MAVDQRPLLVDHLLRQSLNEPQAPGETFQVFVKGSTKDNQTSIRAFSIASGAVIARLMDMIALAEDGCPLENQRLVFGGKSYRADDDEVLNKTLTDIQVGNGSTLFNLTCPGKRPPGTGVKLTLKVFENLSVEARSLGLIECMSDDKVKALELKIWRKFPNVVTNPEGTKLWTNIIGCGDGYVTGKRLDGFVGNQVDHVHLELGITRQEKRRQESQMSRIEATKQLFHAFINRLQAYNVPNQLGLVLFSDEVKRVCDMTRLYERFREHVDRSVASGDTRLWDALLGKALLLLLI